MAEEKTDGTKQETQNVDTQICLTLILKICKSNLFFIMVIYLSEKQSVNTHKQKEGAAGRGRSRVPAEQGA